MKGPEPHDKADNQNDMADDGGGAGKESQSNDRIVAPKPNALWHTPNREAWATVFGRHYPVPSDEFRHWFSGQFFKLNGGPVGRNRLDEFVNTYSAKALFEGPQHRVHLRVAQQDGAVWLDLADAENRAIRIDKEGWLVVPAGKVAPKFFRPPNMRPLPRPLRGEADVSLLRKVLNLPNEDTFRLLLIWLSFIIIPDQPYPVIAVSGPAGAAKSSFAKLVRTTIDPNEVPMIGMPRGQDLAAHAKNNPILCFDNLSAIKPSLADDLCRLATGGGLGGRRLYTDNAEATFTAQRPIILTGINDVATRGDLADRSIMVRLDRISEAERRTDAEIREAFALDHPRILAALLDMVVTGLRRLDDVRRERRRLPRMADFARWGYAVAPAVGWSVEGFERAYRANRNEAFEAVIEDDPIAPHILNLLEGLPDKAWQGTTEQLWTRLKNTAGEAARAFEFPQNAAVLGKALRRIEPALGAHGVNMERERVTAGTRITLWARA
ncbi:MAG TPA: hypothetical protein VJ770_10345 [Stellaceae bacterium]|nr:hypothetical protein [Stellaceae bacterium]